MPAEAPSPQPAYPDMTKASAAPAPDRSAWIRPQQPPGLFEGWRLVHDRGPVTYEYDLLDWLVRALFFGLGIACGIWLGLHVGPV